MDCHWVIPHKKISNFFLKYFLLKKNPVLNYIMSDKHFNINFQI